MHSLPSLKLKNMTEGGRYLIYGLLLSAIVFEPLKAYSQTTDNAELATFIDKRTWAESVARKMFLKNVENCPVTLPEFTATPHRLSDYPSHLRADAARDLNAQKNYTLYLAKHADPSGLQPGDVLLNQKNAPVTAVTKDVLNYRQAGFVRVRREGRELIIAQTGQKTCPYSLEVSVSNRIKGRSKGAKITLSYGLINFAETEDELALIIGHEMSHLIEGHSNAGPFGVTRNKSLEYKADRLGVDFLSHAGFDPKAGIEFWNRLSGQSSSNSSGQSKRYEALKSYLELR